MQGVRAQSTLACFWCPALLNAGKAGRRRQPPAPPLGRGAKRLGMSPAKCDPPHWLASPLLIPTLLSREAESNGVERVGNWWDLPAALAICPSCSAVPSAQPCACPRLCAAGPVPPPHHDSPLALLPLDAERSRFYSESLMI